MSPASMRLAPNHSTPTLETLTMNSSIGNISAISRPAFSDTSVSWSLTPSKRSTSRLAHEGPHDPDAGDLLAQHRG